MYNVAPKDGSYVAMIAPRTISTALVRKVKFDAREFEWLGAPAARSSGVWFWHTSGITSLEQLGQKEVTIGTSGFASAGSVFPRLMNATLGTKLKLIYGYQGGGHINVAVESGEAMGRWNFRSGFTGVRPTWIPEKKVIPVIKMGPHDPDPVFANVPHFRDLLKEGTMGRKMYDVLSMDLEVGQGFYLPQGTPKKVAAILVGAFDRMLADPAFKAKLIKRGIEYSPKSAEQIRQTIKKGFDTATPDVVRELKKILVQAKS
jgi:tripartite-type tricarboxylate transporter receptor subunit TctC